MMKKQPEDELDNFNSYLYFDTIQNIVRVKSFFCV